MGSCLSSRKCGGWKGGILGENGGIGRGITRGIERGRGYYGGGVDCGGVGRMWRWWWGWGYWDCYKFITNLN